MLVHEGSRTGGNNSLETDKAGESVCKFCKQRAMSTGPCYAKIFQIEGGEDFTHVHFGQHNHDLCHEVSQNIMEKWQVEAMKAATKDPKLTASAFTQNQVRQAILQRMEGADLVDEGPDFEG
jgi:hypothetical protein